MKTGSESSSPEGMKEFRRDGSEADRRLSWIGAGAIGGKASGLVFINSFLKAGFDAGTFPGVEVSIPAFTVIRTDVFDAFLEQNHLADIAYADLPDDVIAHEFQRANLPVEILGDLESIVRTLRTPLAIRSSSLLEDALYQPFAGVYSTKMIPNNQLSPANRLQKLMEAIKLVYASTFSQSAKDYLKAIGRSGREEKMAVIIQEVAGKRSGNRFYPEISGVARSYNFYSMGRAKPEEGVVNLALGLGKTIVDGGVCWTYSPQYPAISPPFANPREMLDQTQTEFWAVNMGKPPAFDPIHETEYLLRLQLSDAETDGRLPGLVSTYDVQSDRMRPGLSAPGPRALNFAGMLVHREAPLNEIVKALLSISREALKAPVEIEFAMTLSPLRFSFLQVRPMVVSEEEITIAPEELSGEQVVAASEQALGNGVTNIIRDVIYVKPQTFEAKHTPQIALELERMNRQLLIVRRPYLLIGFGRWGSSDPWLGIPVTWGQVSGAKAFIEATTPGMDVELSQGAHFFHNLTSFRVCYLSIPHTSPYGIDWAWLDAQPCAEETEFLRRIALPTPLRIKVDGRSGRGTIRKNYE